MDKYHNVGRIVLPHPGEMLKKLTVAALTETLGGKTEVSAANMQGAHPGISWLTGYMGKGHLNS